MEGKFLRLEIWVDLNEGRKGKCVASAEVDGIELIKYATYDREFSLPFISVNSGSKMVGAQCSAGIVFKGGSSEYVEEKKVEAMVKKVQKTGRRFLKQERKRRIWVLRIAWNIY